MYKANCLATAFYIYSYTDIPLQQQQAVVPQRRQLLYNNGKFYDHA
jgi:hypothetical protein